MKKVGGEKHRNNDKKNALNPADVDRVISSLLITFITLL